MRAWTEVEGTAVLRRAEARGGPGFTFIHDSGWLGLGVDCGMKDLLGYLSLSLLWGKN